MKKLFLIIGAPGSGKTTDASLIAQNNQSVEHFSTGDLLRAEVATGSELGSTIESYISNGNLVPLSIVVNAIVSAIKNCEKDFIIIDGYPRSVEQMTELDSVLKDDEEVELAAVIEVVVSEEVAQDRILGRARGNDDNAEIFKNRMKVFLDPIEEIRKFYKKQKIFHSINGERSIEEIVSEMNELIVKIIINEG